MAYHDTVIIDGDTIPYSCGFAAKGEPVSHALRLAKNKLNQILEDTGAANYRLFLAGEGNYRDDVCWVYKATRTTPKPEHWGAIREYMFKNWNATKCDGFEADDIVGAIVHESYLKHDSSIICSSADKDLNTCAGWHYNPMSRKTYFVTELQADRFLAYQMLCGDRTDNIKGLPHLTPDIIKKYKLRKAKGCGDTSARNIIQSHGGTPWEDVAYCYASWGMGEGLTSEEINEYMQQQYDLLHICRSRHGDEPLRPTYSSRHLSLMDVEQAMGEL